MRKKMARMKFLIGLTGTALHAADTARSGVTPSSGHPGAYLKTGGRHHALRFQNPG